MLLPSPLLISSCLLSLVSAAAIRSKDAQLQHRRTTAEGNPVVDLGYEVYEGFYNQTSDLNVFKGIRYAAPPVGDLRWQLPKHPENNRREVIQAKDYRSRCPQGQDTPLPADYNFTSAGLGDEDCLFLNVFGPADADKLPVMVWIHGGGYGSGHGKYDFSDMIVLNDHGFIEVSIQYRLGAFGFLSSPAIAEFGTVNAGLYDMHFALEWVQDHIESFGGDPSRVTIVGESAGAGGVMLLTMAYGGNEGTSFFSNAIVASPYLPTQWKYDDDLPVETYNRFAHEVGCLDDPSGAWGLFVFECLKNKDSFTLQNASAYIGGNTKVGQWGFLPVTDGRILQKRPTEQLLAGEVNGLRLLSGHNANEAPDFTPQNIDTADDFDAFVRDVYPLMDNHDISRVEDIYAIPPTVPGPIFSTRGDSGPTALNQSEFAIGQQQRANNLFAEATFVCPSYWLADAYDQSWKYQFSVPPGEHGADLNAYWGPEIVGLAKGTLSPGFRNALQAIWGQFVINDDPTLPPSVISAISRLPDGTATGDEISASASGSWPRWQDESEDGKGAYKMLNLNSTGGHEEEVRWGYPGWTTYPGGSKTITRIVGPGLGAQFDIVDAWSWEGGRGPRCQLWSDLGPVIPG